MPSPRRIKVAKDRDRDPGTRPPKRRPEVRLIIPPGERDVQALRALAREWLMPRLAHEFLRERRADRMKTDFSSLDEGGSRKDK